MHPLLKRQIERHLPAELQAPCQRFLEAVGAAYDEFENDRKLLEHSIEQMSMELTDRNAELRRQLESIKAVEEELRHSYAELKEINHKQETAQGQLLQADKMASIGQLAAGVAHEINNPIGYVYSNLSSLDRYLADLMTLLGLYEKADVDWANETLRHEISQYKANIELDYLRQDLAALMAESKEGITCVKKIVQDLKDFSHVDEGEWQWSDLRHGLDSTLNIVNNEIKTKAEVVRQYGDIPEIQCMALQLNQVFMNLLINASHAIDNRGTITVATGRQAQEVWVKIADSGSGIKKEHLPRIFDAFFTTKPVGKGTGLGLSLSYSIIKKHHGRIEVDSEVGKGTTFTLWLPIKQPVDQPIEQLAVPATAQSGKQPS